MHGPQARPQIVREGYVRALGKQHERAPLLLGARLAIGYTSGARAHLLLRPREGVAKEVIMENQASLG